jgi:predicted O-methyltransferase YrrM
MDENLHEIAQAAKGFMPDDEGLSLHRAGLEAGGRGPMLEIGSYCGKSAVYLGAAAKATDSTLYSVDHHRGSEENQPGEEYHDPDLVDEEGRVDTLPWFRSTIEEAGLSNWVIAVVGSSPKVARSWATPLSLVFIDGGHSDAAAQADYENWAPAIMNDGLLAIHDVFEDPAEGGRPPFEVYSRALSSRAFVEADACGSLRVLRKVGGV